MNKKLILYFLKDRITLTVIFFLNSFLIILFYYLSVNGTVEILYPLGISLFSYVVLMAYEVYKYFKYNMNLRKSINQTGDELQPVNCEQKENAEVIKAIHHRYQKEIAGIGNRYESSRHFLSQWIHSMKTPVSVIDLIIQKGMREGGISFEACKSMREENDRLQNSLEQILNMVRLDDFSRDYVPEAVDLIASVKRIVNKRKNQFIYNKIFPRLQFHREKLLVLTDSKWNEFMLEQFISNAIKYSSGGDADKHIEFIFEHEGEHVILEIRDEGVGIPEYDINRVFEPFFTGENGRKFQCSSGIGLYICAAIAEKLGHKISLESSVGRGTTVQITYLTKV